MPARMVRTGMPDEPVAPAGTAVVAVVTGADVPAEAAFTDAGAGEVTTTACVVLTGRDAAAGPVTVAFADAVLFRFAMAKYEKPGVVAVK
jgi:hypothetical protein